jgi:heme/copper-type cytochrome/quinol oxidase subunit 2
VTRVAAALLLLGWTLGSEASMAARETADPPECASDSTLCLGGGRFLVEASWRTRGGTSGVGHAVSVTADAGYFWFFDPDNVEIVAKTLDGCTVNGRYWFFTSGLTNVEVAITVTDTSDGTVQTYENSLGVPFAPVLDTKAFSGCARLPLLVTLSRFQFTPGGPDGPPILLEAGTSYEITFRATDVEHGISAIPQLGIESRRIAPGDDYTIAVTPTPAQRGRYNFACSRVCGVGHGSMIGAIVVE